MVLIIQIASGIVLGFAIIAYRSSFVKFARWIMAFIAILIAFAVILWLGTEAVKVAEPYAGKFYGTAGLLVAVVSALSFGIIGGFCLVELGYDLGWLKRKSSDVDELSENLIFATGITNAFFVYLVTWPLLAFTPVGDWYAALDRWSQSNGFSFGGAVAVAGICWLWPAIPLWLYSRQKRERASNK